MAAEPRDPSVPASLATRLANMTDVQIDRILRISIEAGCDNDGPFNRRDCIAEFTRQLEAFSPALTPEPERPTPADFDDDEDDVDQVSVGGCGFVTVIDGKRYTCLQDKRHAGLHDYQHAADPVSAPLEPPVAADGGIVFGPQWWPHPPTLPAPDACQACGHKRHIRDHCYANVPVANGMDQCHCDYDGPRPQTPDQSDIDGAIAGQRDTIARLTAERTWQPIETAPKDGTEILLTDRHTYTRTGYWARRVAAWSVDSAVPMDTPTHWARMPLPAPPEAR